MGTSGNLFGDISRGCRGSVQAFLRSFLKLWELVGAAHKDCM